jgi:hypothetical protein
MAARAPIARQTRQQLLAAWVALCVLVAQGLLPLAASRMALARDGAAWAEVCSSAGTRWVRTAAQAGAGADKTSDRTPDSAAAHQQCWACPLLAQAAVAPPPPPMALPVQALCTVHVVARATNAELRPTRGPAAARAPPQQS